MKVVIGSDHRGYAIKQKLADFVRKLGHEVSDAGSYSDEYADYPDFAFAVSERVGKGESDRGVLICGTGLGMCIAANKVTGVRAAPCHDLVTAEMSRRHNDANVLCLGAEVFSFAVVSDGCFCCRFLADGISAIHFENFYSLSLQNN